MKKNLLFIAIMAITTMQAQVSLVKDIHSGSASSMPTYENSRFEYNGNMYFGAYEDVITRMELWKTDGTTNGTTLVKNLGGNGYNGNPRDFLIWSNEMILTANRITGFIGVRSDGTTTGTSELSGAGNPNGFRKKILYNNELYLGKDELYKYTSINASPIMVIDLLGPSYSSSASPVIVYGGELYFTISNIYGYAEIWKTDGTSTGTSLVKEFGEATLNSNSGLPTNFIVYNGKLYFAINGRAFASDPAIGVELWETNGTTAGTVMVEDLNVGAGDSNPSNLTIYNSELYFTATSSALGRELFKVNMSGNIVNVFDIHPSGDSNPSSLFVDSNRLYYAANDGTNGKEIWVTNTYSGSSRVNTTNLFMDINPTGDSNPSGFIKYFGEIYFTANDGTNGQELWKTDLTPTGTSLVHNINPTGDSNPRDFLVANNRLFFTANDGALGEELWKYQDPSLSINEFEVENNVTIYPNPVSNNFTIETNNMIQSVVIYNVQGKLVKSFTENLQAYRVEELNTGVYFIKIKTEAGEVTKKLIKA